MPRWGYALVLALALLLATYALWPAGAADGLAPFPARIAQPFSVTGVFGEQQVADDRVRVAGFDRPADRKAVGRLLAGLTGLRIDAKNLVEKVTPQDAQAWGIDGSRRLVAGAEERQWGEAGTSAAIYDPVRRLAYVLAPETVRGLSAGAARLDVRELLELPAAPAWFIADGVRFERTAGRWQAIGGGRPPVDGRLQAVSALLRAATLDAPGSAPSEAVSAHELRWPGANGKDGRLRLLAHAGRTWLAADGLPPQPLAPAADAAWSSALAALAADRLIDPLAAGSPELVTVSRNGGEILRLERRGEASEVGNRPWTVVWPDGSEPADEFAGERLAAALRTLEVRDPRRAPAPIGPDVVTIAVHPDGGTPWQAVLAGSTLWSDGWAGTIGDLPAPLNALVPATFLDPRPCPLDAQLAVKLQRRWRQEPGRDEVALRAGGGAWARTFPAGAVPLDPSAVQRVVRTLCQLQARSVRLLTVADRALPYDAELAIRFAAKEARRSGGAEDEVELADTVPQERAWTLTRSGVDWSMLDLSGGLAFTIDAAAAEALLADVASDRLYPITSGLVSAIEVGGAEPFRLERGGEAWRLVRRGAPPAAADALAVRRLLRALAALRAGAAATPPPGDLLAIAVETVDGERLVASFTTTSAGVTAMTVRGAALLADREAWSQVELRPAAYLRP